MRDWGGPKGPPSGPAPAYGGLGARERSFRAMTVKKPLFLLLALVALALLGLGSCETRHSGFQGDISGTRINTSLIMVPQAGASLSLSGNLILDSGSATVSLLAPDGSLAWSRTCEKGGSTASEVFGLDLTRPASGGTWTVRVQGQGEATSGSYAISMDLR